MRVGHINLARTVNGAGEHFVGLIESLAAHGVDQFILVGSDALTRRLRLVDRVTVGSVTRSAVGAYCSMPAVDVVQAHDRKSASATLLLTLTRGIPFVLTRLLAHEMGAGSMERAAINRAAGFVEGERPGPAEHMQAYRNAIDSLRVPNMIL